MVAPFPRRIDVTIRDRNRELLPDAKVEWFLGNSNTPAGSGDGTDGHMSWEVADPNAVVSVKATYDGVHQGPVKLGAAQTSYEFVFDIVVHPYWRQFAMKHFPALMGIFFILLAVALAFISNGTNPLQRQLLLGMFALGGGGFGGEIAGFIKADLTLGKKLVVSAGGAAAIFVLLFFFVPAGTLP